VLVGTVLTCAGGMRKDFSVPAQDNRQIEQPTVLPIEIYHHHTQVYYHPPHVATVAALLASLFYM